MMRWHLASTSNPKAQPMIWHSKALAIWRKRVSQERILHFKDGDSFLAYNDKFGTRSLIEGIFGGPGKVGPRYRPDGNLGHQSPRHVR
jgi:hypothetical protein